MAKSPFEETQALASQYGELALENYGRVRRLAELIEEGWQSFTGAPDNCCFIVPPGPQWAPGKFGRQAFSVYGLPHLPLGPVAFGVALLVSASGDYMRFILSAMKEGEQLSVDIKGGPKIKLPLLAKPEELLPLFGAMHEQMTRTLALQIDHYQKGDLGLRDMGFDFFSKESLLPQE